MIYKFGDKGPAVLDIQIRLKSLGYDLGSRGADGRFGKATEKAVRSFQAGNSLDEDGIIGRATWKSLLENTYKLGDRLLYLHFPFFRGADVKRLQALVARLGFRIGDIDGIFGPLTDEAVREFQSNLLLPCDGIVGSHTLKSLEIFSSLTDNPVNYLSSNFLKPKNNNKPLKDLSMDIYYEAGHKRYSKGTRFIAKQAGNLLKIAGAKIKIYKSDGSVADRGEGKSTLFIERSENGYDRIIVLHGSGSRNLAQLIKESLIRIAEHEPLIKQSTNKQMTAGVSMPLVIHDEIFENEIIGQKIAVSIVDAIVGHACSSR